MNRKITFIIVLIVGMLLTSCSSIKEKIGEYSTDKEQCILNEDDVTEFSYQSETYTILEEVVSEKELGNWVGIIRKLVAVDDEGKILKEQDALKISISDLTEFQKGIGTEAYIIQYFNVYEDKEVAKSLIVDVNGEYHKAIPKSEVNSHTNILKFKIGKELNDKEFIINPNDATQLVCNGITYQVTTQEVPEESLSYFINILAKNVIFDVDTKQPLTDIELKKIDWHGTNQSKREEWFYLDIYQISGVQIDKEVAVKVNGRYVLAVAQ